MKNIAVASFILVFLLAGANSVCQAQMEPPPFGDTKAHYPSYDERWWDKKPSLDRPVVSEDRVLKKGPLAPSDEDRANHASFLSQPNTGLIRLLPRMFEQSKFYTEPPVKINGGGSYYSFAFLTHVYGYGSDLELGTALTYLNTTEVSPSHYLQVGFSGADFGMLTNLGEMPLETLTFDDPRTAFLREYEAPHPESEARSEFLRFREGVKLNGQTYRSTLPIQVGAVYLLRSINYGQSDLLVAFRVVREDPDQSLIIAWQLLKRFPTPRLIKSK